MAGRIDKVRALFEPGGTVECVENTYIPARNGQVFAVEAVGKTVWRPTESGFRGTFPTRAGDVLHVDEDRATWRIGRGEHTVTYRRLAKGV